MLKNNAAGAAAAYAENLLGMGYSRKKRYRLFKDGSADCSSFVFSAFLAAGIIMKTRGIKNKSSFRQVYSEDFELVFPGAYSAIGREDFLAPMGFYRDFAWRRGDVIFYCNDSSTRRKNRITHVSLCLDKDCIIHDGNDIEKTCIKDMSYGDGKIAAVMRLKDGVRLMELKKVSPLCLCGSRIMRLQLLLNLNMEDACLDCRGFMNAATVRTLKKYRSLCGLKNVPVCSEDVWRRLLKKIYFS